MKILLTSTASHSPPRGGATRSNLVWIEHLAQHGHECRVVGGMPPDGRAGSGEGITILSIADPAKRVQALRAEIQSFQPDWVLASSEDVGQLLLKEASASAPGRVVYLAHTPQWFPFGPESWAPDAKAAELVKACAGIVVIGAHMAAYVRRHLGREAAVIHPPIYGVGPYPDLARFDAGLVTMINPCAVKGISIFLDVARAMPDVQFGAMPGWGTTSADRAAIAAVPNIQVLPNCKDIEDFLRATRVLLMPSLWYEGFGLIAMEAMLRGIPVVASDSGGLEEAKAGTGYVIPVNPITQYAPVYDELSMPEAVIAKQDIGAWVTAVRKLTTDRAEYDRESASSREHAEKFVSRLDAADFEKWLSGLGKRLRVLLAQNSPYYPAHGGGDRSNRLLVEALAARGHSCRVVARTGGFGAEEHERYLKELGSRGIQPEEVSGGVVRYHLNGVDAHIATAHANLRGYFSEQVAEFQPDVILTSTDDPAQLLLDAALKSESARVIYLARATLALPFGPDCAFPSEQKSDALRQVDSVVGVSEYVAEYVRQWGGRDAVHVPISLMEPGDAPALGAFDNEFVTMVNPCAVKGISIFLELAELMPGVQFAAVPTWGTNESDRELLEGRANVHVLDPVDRIDDLLKRTRVLLVPSLWAEARSRIVVEALLRGIPVLAANIGGIPEAMLGLDYLLPVNPIAKYKPKLDEQMVPVAEVPPQDIGPWRKALAELLDDPAKYAGLSRRSREAALRYTENLNVEPFERLLQTAVRQPKRGSAPAIAKAAHGGRQSLLENLSPEKRRLLALRLKKKSEAAGQGVWFGPGVLEKESRLRLICLPHAGGGMSTFHGWGSALGPRIAVCPARLPGRETRAGETPIRRMDDMVEALARALGSHIDKPYVLFGHSMGAAIAFELTRRFRREGKPLPAVLVASGARAPQFRRDWNPPPEPTDEEFIAELHRLEGMPREVLENRELMRLILPALKADAALYRNYVYSEEEPLPVPIRAYGGAKDPNIPQEKIAGWSEQTRAGFRMRMFPGGHFFLQSAQEAFLHALSEDLAEFIPC